MTTTNRLVASSPASLARENLHLVCGSGGSRAILASAGFLYALHKAGLSDFRTLGGVSGGSIPSLMFAAGIEPGKVVELAIDIDFSSKLTRRTDIVRMFVAFLLRERLALKSWKRSSTN
jgi:predicted acylesterase/phospholipase RssA